MKKILIILLLVIGSIFNGYSQYYSSWFTMPDTSTATLPKTFAKNTLFYVADVSTIYVCDTVLTSGTTLGHWYSNGHLTMIPDVSTYWNRIDGHIYPKTLTDSVGIGTSTPSSLFEVKDLFKSDATNRSLFIGDNVGMSGANDVFLGNYTGQANTSGNNNLFMGFKAGYQNTTGVDNVFVGSFSGYKNTSSNYNVFFGYSSGYNNKGNRNIFIGSNSGNLNTTGSGNVYIGDHTGHNATGDNNVFLGYRAGYNETGSNKLYINNDSTTTPLIYGEFDNNYLNINGHLNATDSLGINSEYVSGFTYLDSITSNIANVVTGVPNAYLDTVSASYLILNNDSISYRKGVAKFHRIDSLNTSSANTWITVKMDTMVGNESTYGFKFNSDSSAIICTQAGIIQVGGCVHYHFYGGSTTLAKLYTRVLIDGQEARCLQTNTNKNRFANATGYQNYIGSVTANKGSTIQLQIQVDNTDLDLQGDAVFDHPVAATIWFNYLSK